jgi:ABC-type branched-subunit amino acid transport system substrate-binding protein
MADLWKNEAPFVDAFIGPVFSVVCEPTGLLAARWNLPMISWGCSSSKLSDKTRYPTFARTKTYGRTNPTNTSLAMAAVMKHFKWKIAFIFYSTEDVWTGLALKVISEFKALGMVARKRVFSPNQPESYEKILKEVRNKSRGRNIILS